MGKRLQLGQQLVLPSTVAAYYSRFRLCHCPLLASPHLPTTHAHTHPLPHPPCLPPLLPSPSCSMSSWSATRLYAAFMDSR